MGPKELAEEIDEALLPPAYCGTRTGGYMTDRQGELQVLFPIARFLKSRMSRPARVEYITGAGGALQQGVAGQPPHKATLSATVVALRGTCSC